MQYFLGIDFGTSGARAIAIDAEKTIHAQTRLGFDTTVSTGIANHWKTVLFGLIEALPDEVRSNLSAIAINGTSSTVLLCDDQGQAIVEPLMYHDGRGISELDRLKTVLQDHPPAPEHQTVLSATSSLAKLLWWEQHCDNFSTARFFLHQADWLAFQLHGQLGISDYHNSLKLGYDVAALRYPDWLNALSIRSLLPIVRSPGAPIALIDPAIALQLGIPNTCQIHAGTTDSIAAFLASQVQTTGDAVTSLGSTLVLKLLSDTRLDDAHYGIYSHRLGDRWLVGGASNTGGAVLQAFFSDEELQLLSSHICPTEDSPLDYYPLLKPGERFPIHDPHYPPQLEPQPTDRVKFLHGLLQSIARIEKRGYSLLESLGASAVQRIFTAGGGGKNPTWTAIRSRQLGVPVLSAAQTEAAFGSALLALVGLPTSQDDG